VDIATVDTISDHVRAAYPAWGPASVGADRNAIVIYLVITGVLTLLPSLAGLIVVVSLWRPGHGFSSRG